MVPGVLYAIARLWRREWPKRWGKLIFLLLWFAPAWTYYAIVHMGQQGLVFVFLPVLLLISAVGLTRLLLVHPRRLTAAAIILVMVNVGIFCLSPEYPVGGNRLRLLTRTALVNSDRYYQDRFEAIESVFAPESTAILAASWHHVEYYLPSYSSVHLDLGAKWERDEGELTSTTQEAIVAPTELGLQLDGQGRATIVVFDPSLTTFIKDPVPVYGLPLMHGGTLEYLVLAGDQTLRYGGGSEVGD